MKKQRFYTAKNNGTSFTRPYMPDEYKTLNGPIEFLYDKPVMNKRPLLVATFLTAVIGGAGCFLWAIISRM